MGKDNAEKKRLKLDKKRIKAHAKLEKVRAKAGQEPVGAETTASAPPQIIIRNVKTEPVEKPPWYKNPEWVRAIVAIASLIVTVIAVFLALNL